MADEARERNALTVQDVLNMKAKIPHYPDPWLARRRFWNSLKARPAVNLADDAPTETDDG